jgi:hypothetical protein
VWTEWAVLALAILVVGLAYLYKLGGTPLWGDEAGTGLFARNVLHFGYPTGFDGRNLSIYEGGAELNAHLVVAKIPWIQFYIGALSLQIFGNDAQGLRTLFAVLGLLALFPMQAALRSRVPSPLFVSTLILVTPQVALFHRSARYYPILTLVFALLVWLVCSEHLSRARRLCLACICMVVMFHAHPVAAFACALALLVHAAWQRHNFTVYLFACAVGFASWCLWTALVGPTLVVPQLFMDFQGIPPSEWMKVLGRNLGAAFMDLDAVQALPLLAWVVGLGLFWVVRPRALSEFSKDPLVCFVVLTLLVHTFVVAVLFGTETSEEHSLLRYMPHLIAFMMVLPYLLVAKLVSDVRLFAVVCLALVATNLTSISYWKNPADKPIPLSWWPATYQEAFNPRPDAIDAVMAVIRSEPGRTRNGMETLLVIPSWLQEVAIFYLGDEFIVVPNIEPDSVAEGVVRVKIGQAALSRFSTRPKWVLHEAPQAPDSVPGYARFQIPVHRLRPDDGTRPELTRHTFYQPVAVGQISLYRRLE